MIAILGGGISGISAGYHLNVKNIENTIFEKNNTWGGLCDNFTLDGQYVFDNFVHLSFAKDENVKELFAKSTDYIKHKPLSTNFYKGVWLKHPAQNNLANLSVDEKVKIISDFINKPAFSEFKNYKEWLQAQFGNYFSENFSEVYTKKYWTVSADQLTTDWLGNRFSIPQLDNLLKGAFVEQEENFYYTQEMRYPQNGGYKSFLTYMAANSNIETNKEVNLVDITNRRIDFTDGTFCNYEKLISSLPLPELIQRIKDVPNEVTEACQKLLCTSGQLVSIGLNCEIPDDNIWFYIYDEDILPSRAYYPSKKSPNNAPEGKSSIQFETYFSKYNPPKLKGGAMIEHIIEKAEKMKLFSKNEVSVSNYKEQKYANVVFDLDRSKNVEIVHSYLKSKDIKAIGRFGEWDYLWSDQSLLSGKKSTENEIYR